MAPKEPGMGGANEPLPIIYHPDYSTYSFGANHPANPHKRFLLLRLFEVLGYPLSYIEPEPATDEDLLTVHTSEYIHCVRAASSLSWAPGSLRFGLDTPDVPIFPNMDDAARLQVGGTLMAARMIADGTANRVLQLGGGFHHAMPARAAGFCIYNDLSVAIKHLRSQGLRVAYIDVDVHHGDGVQWVHYRDPDVLTISLHESGRYLFPNTGAIDELGEGDGEGSAINVPFEQLTDDASYLEAFERVVPKALNAFKPDILVVPCGVDAHYIDPLAHIMLTTHGLVRVFQLILTYADEFTRGRALFTMGGGYDDVAAVRNWAIFIHLLQGRPVPDEVPTSWLEGTRHAVSREFMPLHDALDEVSPAPNREKMATLNRDTVDRLLGLL